MICLRAELNLPGCAVVWFEAGHTWTKKGKFGTLSPSIMKSDGFGDVPPVKSSLLTCSNDVSGGV